jgi:hypothetical protein
MTKTYVRTMNGHAVELLNPEPSTIDLDDIIYNLCNAVRFNGGMDPAWTVGSHSLLVLGFSYGQGDPEEVQRWAFMHDWHEAYTGDLPSPLKAIINKETEVLNSVERALDDAIAGAFGLMPPTDETRELVHKYDVAAFEYEKVNLRGGVTRGALPLHITRLHEQRFTLMDRAAEQLGLKGDQS